MQLAYQLSRSTSPNPHNLVIIHGLCGFSKNFNSLAKHKTLQSKFNSYLIDLRNHGDSPHDSQMSIKQMAQDVHGFMQQHGLLADSQQQTVVLGHSLGATIIMQMMHDYQLNSSVDKAVIVDMGVKQKNDQIVSQQLADHFRFLNQYHQSMQYKEYKQIKQELYDRFGNERWLIGLMMLNVVKRKDGQGYTFRFNIDAISQHYPQFFGYDLEMNHRIYDNPVLVLKGSDSPYIDIDKQQKLYSNIFSDFEIKTLEGGHAIHFDNPFEFMQAVADFVQ